jgi:hypothetical protein
MVRGFYLRTNILYTFKLIELNFESYIKKQKATHDIAKSLLMIVSSKIVIALLAKRNSAVTISKNGPHFPQKITNQLSLTRKE